MEKQCNIVADKAKNIIELRQTKNDLYEVIEMFDQVDSVIVIDAFSQDHVDTLTQLGIQIDSFGEDSFEDESRKYDEMVAKQKNIINSFNVKYFSDCFKKIMP